MDLSLDILVSSVTILALVFLFLYFKQYKEYIDLKSKYDELRRSEDYDRSRQKSRDDFLAMLVHELRSPLAVIKGSADLIINEAEKLEKSQIFDLLSQIKNSSSDLLLMVNDLLDVSKIESGIYEVSLSEQSVNDLLTEESHRYMALAREKGINIKINLDPSVGTLKFDTEKIKQVVNNLLSNSLKFTPVDGEITISSKRVGSLVQVIVTDTGVGVPADVKPKLFHKFVQIHNNVPGHEKGTGLGLCIAKGIVEAHKGKIWVEDNDPKGAKFVFTLPI